MAYAIYQSNGGVDVDADGQSVAVTYPTTVNADDILIVALLDADNDTFDNPVGWTQHYEDGSNNNCSVAFYWKRADGTETGTETFTSVLGSGQLTAGIMYRFSGCRKYGSPFEHVVGLAVATAASRVVASASFPFARREQSLAVVINVVEDNTYTGLTGTDWVEESNDSTTQGSDGHFILASHEGATTTGTKPSELTLSYSGSENNGGVHFYLAPVGDVPVTLNTADVHDFGNTLTPTLEFTPSSGEDGGMMSSFEDAKTGALLQTVTGSYAGQTFTGDGNLIWKLGFWLDLTLDPPTGGAINFRIYAHDGGTYGTNGRATGTALATTASVNTGDLVDGWNEIELTTPYQTVFGTYYAAAAGLTTSLTTGGIGVSRATDGTVHDGNSFTNSSANSAYDMLHRVYSLVDTEVEIQIDTVNTFDSTGIFEGWGGGSDGAALYTVYAERGEGMSFEGNGNNVYSVSFSLKQRGTPTGNIYAELWTCTGTLAIPIPNELFEYSVKIVASTISATRTWYTFTFPNKPFLEDGVKYFVALRSEGGSTSSNGVDLVAIDTGDDVWGNGAKSTNYVWASWNASSKFLFRIDYQHPLIGKLSRIPHVGFANTETPADTDPFNDNQKLDYDVQATAGGQGLITTATNTYYIDGSDATATDPDAAWTDEANIEDGSTGTYGFSSTDGTDTTNETIIEGTNAPSTATNEILGVSARIYYENVGHEAAAWTIMQPLLTPTGGWTFAKVAALEVRAFKYYTSLMKSSVQIHTDGLGEKLWDFQDFITDTGADVTFRLFKIEIKVTAVPDIGYGTYYWRARAIVRFGIWVWDAWAATKSFLLTAGTTTTTTTAAPTTTTTTTAGPSTTTTTTTAAPTTTTTTSDPGPTTTTTTTTAAPADFTKLQVNITDVWKSGADMKINVGDVWKDVANVWQNIGDVWKKVT